MGFNCRESFTWLMTRCLIKLTVIERYVKWSERRLNPRSSPPTAIVTNYIKWKGDNSRYEIVFFFLIRIYKSNQYPKIILKKNSNALAMGRMGLRFILRYDHLTFLLTMFIHLALLWRHYRVFKHVIIHWEPV